MLPEVLHRGERRSEAIGSGELMTEEAHCLLQERTPSHTLRPSSGVRGVCPGRDEPSVLKLFFFFHFVTLMFASEAESREVLGRAH